MSEMTQNPAPQADDSQNGEVFADVKQLQKERDEYKAGWQRAVADYQNLQKEVERRRSELVRWSEEQILSEFIPVHDHFKKAMGNTDTRINADYADNADGSDRFWVAWKQGIEMIMKQFGDVLKSHGVTEIETVGKKFDPTLHEIVGEEEVEGKEGIIVREVEGGYVMGEKVIKVAKVIVSKRKS